LYIYTTKSIATNVQLEHDPFSTFN